MSYPALPEKVLSAIASLKTAPITDAEIFRNWWDAQVDSLLDEFNSIPNLRYDDWIKYLKKFSDSVSKAVPESETQVSTLFKLTFNQLGRIDFDSAAHRLQETLSKQDKTEKEIDEKYQEFKEAVKIVMQLIKSKWRYNSNFTAAENAEIYASQYQLLPSYQYSTASGQNNDEGYLTRAFDRLEHFLGSVDEYFRMFPLTNNDYEQLIAYEDQIPAWYNKLKDKLTAEQKQEIDKVENVEFKMSMETGIIQEMISGADLKELEEYQDNPAALDQAILKRLDLNETFTQWWNKSQEKIEKLFSQIAVPMLIKLFPDKKLNDEQLIEHEKSLRVSYYGLLREMEVFDEAILRERWGIDKNDPHLNIMIFYKQTLTKKLRMQENLHILEKRKTEFVDCIGKYELKAAVVASSMQEYVLKDGKKTQAEDSSQKPAGDVDEIRARIDKETTYMKQLLFDISKIYTENSIENHQFFTEIIAKIDASELSLASKLDFLSFLIKTRERLMLPVDSSFKDKRLALSITIKLNNWLAKHPNVQYTFSEMQVLEPQVVLAAVKACSDAKDKKDLLTSCIDLITGRQPEYKAPTENIKKFQSALETERGLFLEQDQIEAEEKFTTVVNNIVEGLEKYFAGIKDNVGNKTLRSYDSVIEIIKNNRGSISGAVQESGTAFQRAQKLKNAVHDLPIPTFFKQAMVEYLTVPVNISNAYIDSKEFHGYKNDFSTPEDFLADAIFNFVTDNKTAIPLYQFGIGLKAAFISWQEDPFNRAKFFDLLAHRDMDEGLKGKLLAHVSEVMKKDISTSAEKGAFAEVLAEHYNEASASSSATEEKNSRGTFSSRRLTQLAKSITGSTSLPGFRASLSLSKKGKESLNATEPVTSEVLRAFPAAPQPVTPMAELLENILTLYENLEQYVVSDKPTKIGHPVFTLIKPYTLPLVAAYNKEGGVPEAIRAVLEQLYQNLKDVHSLPYKEFTLNDKIFTFEKEVLKPELVSAGLIKAHLTQPLSLQTPSFDQSSS